MANTNSETFEFSFTGAPTLEARRAVGTLTIPAGEPGQAHVGVTKSARPGFFGGDEPSEAELAEIEVSVTQQGERIVIDGPHRRDGRPIHHVKIEVTAQVPAQTNLDLRIAAGQARASGVSGQIVARVDAGNFDAREITCGEGSELRVNAGNISVNGALAQGATMDVEVNAGTVDMALPRATAVNLDAKANAGAIHLDGWPIQVTRRFAEQRASGPLAPNASGVLRIRVNAGSVKLRAR